MKLEGEIRIPSGCAISGIMSKSKKLISGEVIAKSMIPMHDRSNGLGGGFAGYGIYPEYKDHYAFHIFFNNESSKTYFEKEIVKSFKIIKSEEIPTQEVKEIANAPMIYRYFLSPLNEDKNLVVNVVNELNSINKGIYIFSSGKNMGVFKGVGYPEDIAKFYKLDTYKAYCWIAHGRYPTNTPGWWGGAHPFALGEYSVVHNGEISSYDTNRRNIESKGYKCVVQTDSEVMVYVLDYLLRKKGFTPKEVSEIVAPPFWKRIDKMVDSYQKRKLIYFRENYQDYILTGPFSIIVGNEEGMFAINDRLKLRSMVALEDDDMVYIASEECAIREISSSTKEIYSPKGGEIIEYRYNKEDR